MRGLGLDETCTSPFFGTVAAADELSKVRILPEFCRSLQYIGDFSHLIILYWFHLRDNKEERRTQQVVPKRHSNAPPVGVFASRSPSRPNPIGFCVVELIGIEGCDLLVRGLDAVQDSPVTDIKPYIPRDNSVPNAHVPEWTLHGPAT